MYTRPRGAIPTPRHILAAAAPYQITGPTPAQAITVPPHLSYWNNNQHGCCVTTESAFAKACYSPEIFITDATVLGWASQHGVLEGADIGQVMDWMASDGFHQDGNQYNEGPKAAVDWTNANVLQNAIANTKAVKLGVAANQLEHVVGQRNGWIGTGFRRDGNLDHCISACAYGTMGWLAQQLGGPTPNPVWLSAPAYGVFTWDTIGILDVPSFIAITGEAWSRNPTTIINGQDPTPAPVPPPQPIPVPIPPPGPSPGPVIDFMTWLLAQAWFLDFVKWLLAHGLKPTSEGEIRVAVSQYRIEAGV